MERGLSCPPLRVTLKIAQMWQNKAAQLPPNEQVDALIESAAKCGMKRTKFSIPSEKAETVTALLLEAGFQPSISFHPTQPNVAVVSVLFA